MPLTILALASGGGDLSGATDQQRPVAVDIVSGGRSADWRIGYLARCEDGTSIRGRYVSGRGTPRLALGRDGRFRLSRTEPAEFRPEGTGSATFTIAGRIRPDGGSGTWRLRLVTPPGTGRRIACTAGPLGWRVARP